MTDRWHRWIEDMRRDVMALYLGARDPRVPLLAKVLVAGTVAYALSPIDLIPDFIPVLGLIDDVVIVPFAIWATLKFIPADVIEDLRAQAATRLTPLPKSVTGAAMVLFLWVVLAAAIWLAVVALHD